MVVDRSSAAKDSSVLVYMRTASTDVRRDRSDTHSSAAGCCDHLVQPALPIDYDDTDDPLLDSSWWATVKWFAYDFVHDCTPLWMLAVHVLLFFLCVCFGPLTLPWNQAVQNSLIASQGEGTSKAVVEVADIARQDLSHLKTIRNGLCFILTTMILYVGTLLAVMLLRYIVIKLFVQPLYNFSRLAVVVTYAIDPAAAYCIWAIVNYGIFRKYTKPVLDQEVVLYYRFVLFGRRFSHLLEIDVRCYRWANSICHLQVLIALRKLVLSSLLFLFEVSFLPNYSSELKGFLNDQALLRRFNVAWLNFVNLARECDHHEVIQRVEAARRAIERIEMPDAPVIYDHHVLYNADNFKIFRSAIHGWRRRRTPADCDMRHKLNEVPQFYKEKWIKRCSTNVLTNWSALNYMVHNPPELLFMDYYVPLACRGTVQEYSRLLFDHIYETMSALNKPAAVAILQSPRRRCTMMKSCVLEARGTRATLEVPLEPLASHLSARFSVEPLTARNRSHTHFGRIHTTAVDSESGDEDESGGPSEPWLKSNSSVAYDDRRHLTPKMLSCLNSSVVNAFFAAYDIGNCGYITSSVFTRNVLYMCSIRKRLMSTLKNQRSILNLVGRLLSTVLWFVIFVMFLMTLRVNKNIVLPSTIGFFSAMIVALSYMYTSFITAIIFVVLSNPYNVGDRIRINNGEPMYVKSITTYNTEFRCVHDKVITYQNSVLSTLKITNETRARHAAHELVLRVCASTTPAALKQLIENIKSYVNGRPREFVKDGCYIYGSEVQVGHYYLLNVVLTYLDNWSNPRQIFLLRNDVFLQLAKQCRMLGISYKQPVEPVHFSSTLSYTGGPGIVPASPCAAERVPGAGRAPPAPGKPKKP